MLAAVALAALYCLLADKRYEARAKVLVSPIGSEPAFVGFSLLRDDPGGPRAVETAAGLVETAQIADAVALRLGLERGAKLLDSVEADPVGNTNVLDVVGHAGEAARAAQIANAFAEELVSRRSARFQTELAVRLRRLRGDLSAIPSARRTSPRGV